MSDTTDRAALAPSRPDLPHLAALHRFVVDKALPHWGSGIHRDGAFVEHMHMDGRPDHDAVRRLRVQARQIYVFSHATLLGLIDARAIVARAFDRMLADYWQQDGGFIFSVDADGAPRDRTHTAYDHAFALFAMAWMYRLTSDPTVLEWARRTLAFMDERLADGTGAYADSVGAATRGQNPHMHLLEAVLELYGASGDPDFLARADTLHGLFQTRFFDRTIPALREFFDAGWQPDPVTGDRLDPGHQLEWVWLLDRYTRARPTDTAEIDSLFAFAKNHGTAPDGLILDEVATDGRVLRGTKRLWPQTEHLKALVVRFERGIDAAPGEIDRVCGLLMQHYLDITTGVWNDQVGEDGARLSRLSPASSFYHLFLAYAEAMRVAARAPEAMPLPVRA